MIRKQEKRTDPRAGAVARGALGILGVMAAVGLAAPAGAVAQVTPERALLHRAPVTAPAVATMPSSAVSTEGVASRPITGERALLRHVASAAPPSAAPANVGISRPAIVPGSSLRVTGERALLGKFGGRGPDR